MKNFSCFWYNSSFDSKNVCNAEFRQRCMSKVINNTDRLFYWRWKLIQYTGFHFEDKTSVTNYFDSLHKNEVLHQGFLQKMWPNPQFPSDLFIYTEEIPNEKLHFLYCDCFLFSFFHICSQWAHNFFTSSEKIWTQLLSK